ncbi:MAG: carboxypeptidase-like regulatory domain-containing protein [Gemmatimonadota bacterium]|nr:carboxypeptidase-like regulatory domain-containing protein [Gemmatimonadota bacterium]
MPLRSRLGASARTLWCALLIIHALSATTAGQTIVGTALEAGGALRVSGALVSLLDADGAATDQTLTSASGAFLLRAPVPGTYRVRIERIGYADWLSETYTLEEGERRSVEVRVSRDPVRLDALHVEVTRTCVGTQDGVAAVEDVWSEARKALESSVEAQDVVDLRFDTTEQERWLDAETLAIRDVSTRRRTRVRLPPFEVPSGETFAADGFARFPGDSTIYLAPDAAALLSSAFHASHCFGLTRTDADGEPRIGLTFTPRPDRAVPEIDGVMWLAEETAELRRVEFNYVHVPLPRGVNRRLLEGVVVFDRLPQGPFYVSEWRLRLPISGRFYVDLPGADRSRVVLAGYKETAGSVSAAYAGNRPIFGGTSISLRGAVHDSVTGEPVAGATLLFRDWDLIAQFAPEGIIDTVHVAIADSLGRFEVPYIEPGEYAVEVRRPAWEPLGLPPLHRRVLVGRDADVVELFARSEDHAFRALCPESPLHRGEGAIVGLLRTTGGAPLPDRVVQARWVVPEISILPDGSVSAHERARYANATTDSTGLFVVCGVPGWEELVLREMGTELGVAVSVRRRVTRQDLYVEP